MVSRHIRRERINAKITSRLPLYHFIVSKTRVDSNTTVSCKRSNCWDTYTIKNQIMCCVGKIQSVYRQIWDNESWYVYSLLQFQATLPSSILAAGATPPIPQLTEEMAMLHKRVLLENRAPSAPSLGSDHHVILCTILLAHIHSYSYILHFTTNLSLHDISVDLNLVMILSQVSLALSRSAIQRYTHYQQLPEVVISS